MNKWLGDNFDDNTRVVVIDLPLIIPIVLCVIFAVLVGLTLLKPRPTVPDWVYYGVMQPPPEIVQHDI